MKFVILISIYVLQAFGFPQKANDERILNGVNVNISEYPYQVSVRYGGRHLCGGSIINTKVVLTAAHCTYGMNNNLFEIHAGASVQNNSNEGQIIKVAKVIQHENYNPTQTNQDLSIFLLEKPLEFNDNIQPIALAKTEAPQEAIAIVTGYGFVKDGGPLSEQLQKVELPLINREKCNSLYHGIITKYMICAGYDEGGKDACQGDSGGPLVYNNELIGVVSWGAGCGVPNKPGVYSNVPSMLTWIKLNSRSSHL